MGWFFETVFLYILFMVLAVAIAHFLTKGSK